MTTLREAAQQALEAMTAPRDAQWQSKHTAAVKALEAALAEPTGKQDLQVEPGQEPVANEIHGCHGGEGSTLPEQSVQEPVAWMFSDPINPKMRFVEWQKETKSYMGEWIKTPLYTAPPQRKPLTEQEIYKMYNALWRAGNTEAVAFVRAIERAHGIGGNNESA